MVAGDIVSSVTAGNFQPAVGVEVVILSFLQGAGAINLTDGVTSPNSYVGAWSAVNNANRGGQMNHKVCVTNAIYINFVGGFSGIQIK
jgi:hypothetical protein